MKTSVDFWSGIGCSLQGNYGSVRTYLSFQFQMSLERKKEREKCEFEMELRHLFCCCSILSNNYIITEMPGNNNNGIYIALIHRCSKRLKV